MRIALTLAISFVAFRPCAGQNASVEHLLAQEDSAIQAQITKTLMAFGRGGSSESEFKTNWRGFRELAALKDLADDEEHLVQQLANYAVVEPGIEETQVLGALLVLQMLNLKATIPIRVLAPYLDADNELLREFVREWFNSHDSRDADRSPRELDANYKDYLDSPGAGRAARNPAGSESDRQRHLVQGKPV
jgi:hypothetical protein